MAAGAAGFCTRETAPKRLLDIVASIANGQMVFPYLDVRGLLSALARGRTSVELAQEFAISVTRTRATHRKVV